MNSTNEAITRLTATGLTIASVRGMRFADVIALVRNRQTLRAFSRCFRYIYERANWHAGVTVIHIKKIVTAYLMLMPDVMFSGQARPEALIVAAERMLASIETASPTLQADVAAYLDLFEQWRQADRPHSVQRLRNVLQSLYDARTPATAHILAPQIARLEALLNGL